MTSNAALGPLFNEKYDISNKYPNFTAWHKRVFARPSVQKAYEGTPHLS